jgi:hypothetical protein
VPPAPASFLARPSAAADKSDGYSAFIPPPADVEEDPGDRAEFPWADIREVPIRSFDGQSPHDEGPLPTVDLLPDAVDPPHHQEDPDEHVAEHEAADAPAGVSDDVADLIHSDDEIDSQDRRTGRRPGVTPRDWLAGQLIDIGTTGLESTLWKIGEEVASQLHPLGPQVVRGLYVTKQLAAALKGLRSGDGFYFKVSAPGLDLPAGLELVFRIRLGYRNEDAAGYGFRAEIQVFEPWLDDMDIKTDEFSAADKLASGVPAVGAVAGAAHPDPWRVWLVLIGADLIRDLAATLARAANVPTGAMLAQLLAQRAVGFGEVRPRL